MWGFRRFGTSVGVIPWYRGGGFDYTGADGQGWMSDVGFRETYAEHLVGPDSMVVGIK
jgi:hypothetical protein